nr:gamma-glutamyltransferase [Actinomycetota bacterium]
AAALIALGLLEGLPKTLHSRIEATKLALADAYAHLADEPLPTFLLEPAQLAARRALVRPDRALEPEASVQPRGGTTYLCAVDGDRNAVSLIQSTYYHWGSGVLAGDTGIVLQNRAWGFSSEEEHPNRLAPGRRPFHTIIPGVLLREGSLWGPFGVMGGPMQAQGHVQLVHGLVDRGLDPQRALDAPRFRVDDGRRVALEAGLASELGSLQALGHDASVAADEHGFGVGQCVLVEGEALVGGSDGRGDGAPGGL